MRETDGTLDPSAGVGHGEAERLAAAPRHRLLVEQLPLVTYVEAATPAGTSLYPSRQAEVMLGYPVENWLDDPEFFSKILHPDDRENVLALRRHPGDTEHASRLAKLERPLAVDLSRRPRWYVH